MHASSSTEDEYPEAVSMGVPFLIACIAPQQQEQQLQMA
jgi:hypothetical protein